jgi:hypothetical protein
MSSLRRTALVGGIFYLLTFVGSIPAFFLQEPVLAHPDYVVSSLTAEPASPATPPQS